MIKILALDVDGTLTDGKIYMSAEGETMKAFHVKDGFGIKKIQQDAVEVVLITGRDSEIVNQRGRELGIKRVFQNVENKLDMIERIMEESNVDASEIAYMGDDENDFLPIMKCGLSACPGDAVDSVKQKVDFISHYDGGEGAVREFIEYIISKNDKE